MYHFYLTYCHIFLSVPNQELKILSYFAYFIWIDNRFNVDKFLHNYKIITKEINNR